MNSRGEGGRRGEKEGKRERKMRETGKRDGGGEGR